MTELPDFADAGLVPIDGLVFGGHDVVDTPLAKQLERLVEGGVIPAGIPALVDLDIEHDLVLLPSASCQLEQVGLMATDIRAFAERHQLARVVAINVASTEPPCPAHPAHHDLAALRSCLSDGESLLPASSVAALAAFEAGAAFVDFTPSNSIRLPAVQQWAIERGLPYGGQDAKTGETLVKSVLAPMFAARALQVHAWSGTNLLGGGDGATLADPDAARSKSLTKEKVVADLLGPDIAGEVHIDYVPPMGDWKTAWDHIAFSGFLGTRMTLQFTWQGCDSALAAPLVLDLARLSGLALERAHTGPMPFLGFFFKDPLGSREHSLARQYDTLVTWTHP
ncbi:inositol-3-phosphate synthase [Kribbella sp. NBC_01245]|uniref:inositol-3-phosphate synthase n=1 Tax=Kribbella sp. NBC_01245 TaxID=2903578 RepID=UPI002E2D69C0|nr:inositol-3-phosphate synthase [Kribbella sp. NBC_01245]